MSWKFSDLNPELKRRIAMAGHPAATALQPKGTKPNAPSKVKGVMNDLEKKFYGDYVSPREQSGEFTSCHYEGLTLPLAHRCTYTPDFFVRTRDGEAVAFEIKAPHRFKEKGVIKLKVAASLFQNIHFYLCEKKEGKWRVKRIPAILLSSNPVGVAPDQDE